MMPCEFVDALHRNTRYTNVELHQIGRDLWRAIEAFYVSPQLDALLDADVRHQKDNFAIWFAQNERRVQRLANRYSRIRERKRRALLDESKRLKFAAELL